jgi:ribosomal protein S6
MRHRREGYYVVTEFTAEPAVAAEIGRLLDLSDEVLRHKTMRLPDRIKPDRTKQVKAGPPSAASASPEKS